MALLVIFGVDNSSPFHTDNLKHDFSVLDEGPIGEINGNVGTEEKKFSITFNKANTKFYQQIGKAGLWTDGLDAWTLDA